MMDRLVQPSSAACGCGSQGWGGRCCLPGPSWPVPAGARGCQGRGCCADGKASWYVPVPVIAFSAQGVSTVVTARAISTERAVGLGSAGAWVSYQGVTHHRKHSGTRVPSQYSGFCGKGSCSPFWSRWGGAGWKLLLRGGGVHGGEDPYDFGPLCGGDVLGHVHDGIHGDFGVGLHQAGKGRGGERQRHWGHHLVQAHSLFSGVQYEPKTCSWVRLGITLDPDKKTGGMSHYQHGSQGSYWLDL